MKYKLSKMQISMLIEGKPIQRNHTKIYASSSVKEALGIFRDNNMYDKCDVFVDDGNNVIFQEK